jgi:hypothetical protein
VCSGLYGIATPWLIFVIGKAPQEADRRQASDEGETDGEDYDSPVETDADRRRMMAGAMSDKELASLKTQARLDDFWLDKEKGKGTQKATNDPDETGDSSNEAEETLKKFGLSPEENVGDRNYLPASSMMESLQRTKPNIALIGPRKESTAVHEAEGEWTCKACTL